EEMAAVRQKPGKPLATLATRFRRSHRLGAAAPVRNARNPHTELPSEDDDACPAPGSAGGVGRVTECHCQPCIDFNFLQFSAGKKPERAAVRRPEGIARAIGTPQLAGGERIQLTYPESVFAGCCAGERQAPAVRRYS